MLEGPLDPEIRAACPHPGGKYLFYGKQDGIVTYFDVQSATHGNILYRHALNVKVTSVAYNENGGIVVKADESSHVMVTAVQDTSVGGKLVSTAS
jgi:WD40 repeat protein